MIELPRQPMKTFAEQIGRRTLAEDTVVVPKSMMTATTQKVFNNSSERRCKLIFDQPVIRVPTSFIVLPYRLKLSNHPDKPPVMRSKSSIPIAVKVGQCLLEINKATAKLSFWLLVKKDLLSGGSFESEFAEWLRRARTEPTRLIAHEMVTRLECEEKYIPLCQEILEEEESISNAFAYFKNPMRAAYNDIKRITNKLLEYYKGKPQFFYLVDEYRGVPTSCYDECGAGFYPLLLEHDKEQFERLLLPFISISVMGAISINGLYGLKRLLGLPSSACNLPSIWESESAGLVHGEDNWCSVATFAVLQRSLHETFAAETQQDSVFCNSKPNLDLAEASELTLLIDFYQKYDPLRIYSDLRKVSDKRGTTIWTTDDVLAEIEQGDPSLKATHDLRQYQNEIIVDGEQIEK